MAIRASASFSRAGLLELYRLSDSRNVGVGAGQSYGDVELIIVDDGSSDASPTIAANMAEQHAGRVTLLRTNREGPYPARNVGLAHAHGEFVAFLDADDYWEHDFLEKLHSRIV